MLVDETFFWIGDEPPNFSTASVFHYTYILLKLQYICTVYFSTLHFYSTFYAYVVATVYFIKAVTQFRLCPYEF